MNMYCSFKHSTNETLSKEEYFGRFCLTFYWISIVKSSYWNVFWLGMRPVFQGNTSMSRAQSAIQLCSHVCWPKGVFFYYFFFILMLALNQKKELILLWSINTIIRALRQTSYATVKNAILINVCVDIFSWALHGLYRWVGGSLVVIRFVLL